MLVQASTDFAVLPLMIKLNGHSHGTGLQLCRSRHSVDEAFLNKTLP